MQLNKIFKGLVIALPVVTMMACTSTDESAKNAAAEEARIAQEQAEADRKAQDARDSMVEAGTVKPMLTPAEEMKQELVVIEGHCDSRGTPEYNIALGESRAKSVQTYLLNAGVSASQISVVSYGEEKPVNNGTSEAAFAENRRGVLVY